ncbi:innexin inx2 [Dermatophagoides farinae]|uniref:Innexin n=1 Tax=Dermatophagoides farinae TaxID=6954 RepID=A0A922L5H7_DERFA|nr:innexin inx2-like [Dermatophagoides farinae]XP_046913840.1 innexin inx2-like [Dermatophagoides farinae]KAH7637008.1 innexin-like protein [Dermatophagoides farinae]KAH9510758.1 Structural component of gap junctions [Dermatophagoides farinae]
MVYDVLGSIRSLIKLDDYSIDNNVFRLHYKATVIFLVAFSLLVTSNQYFGDPIDCIQRDDVPPALLDTYCWIHSTFTLPDALDKKIGVEVPHPGIDKYTPGEKRVYHKYYQWVCFVLFLQAVMFYIPRYLWKMWEGRRLKSLVLHLDSPIMDKDDRDEQVNMVVDYFRTNIRYHNSYFYYYVFCEFLNFVNVILQMYLIDAFLGGAFSTYGFDVIQYTEMDQENRVDPMIAIFPRMTKCTFHRYGSSGDVQRHDALCILPLNIVNEKIYVFLWFWFVFLAIITGALLVYRLFVIFLDPVRKTMLKSRARLCNPYNLNIVLSVTKIGDWFLLYLLCKNMEGQNFREFIERYSEEIMKSSNGNDNEKEPIINKSGNETPEER